MPDPRSSPSPLPETDLPHGVRFAQPGDYTQLFALLITAHAENGRGGVDRAVVSSTIHAAIDGNRYVMGVVPGPKGVEAVIGLQPNKPWWGDDTTWYYSELLIYVRPDCRRSHHFSKLMAFAHWWSNYVKTPVVLDVQPVARLEAKLRAFGRHARMIGGSFLMDGPNG